MHPKFPHKLMLLPSVLLAAMLSGPASAQDQVPVPVPGVCARLLDSTGTQIDISVLGTIQSFICHAIPVLNGQTQGYVICGGDVINAAATGAGADAFNTAVSATQCDGPFTLDTTDRLRPIKTYLTPDGGSGNTFTIPLGTEVLVDVVVRGAGGLGVYSTFTFTGGNCELKVTRRIFTLAGPVTLTQIKEIADFDSGTQEGDSSLQDGIDVSFGLPKERLAVKLVDPRRFGGAVVLKGAGNTRGSLGRRYPTQAYGFSSADLEAEFTTCFPSSSATRNPVEGDRAAALFLNFQDDWAAGSVPLKTHAGPGSEYIYSFSISAD